MANHQTLGSGVESGLSWIFCSFAVTMARQRTRDGWNCQFQNHRSRKVGTRSRQCRPKVPGRFAFPGAQNPRICSMWRVPGRFFQQFPRGFPRVFVGNPRTDPRSSHCLLEFYEKIEVVTASLVRRFTQRMDLRERSGVTCVNLHLRSVGVTCVNLCFWPQDLRA